ncbi:MAG: hypothetical protein JXA66_07820 [Oligoflexia bacterium]|nr:hypothetical protein [Oligoflexia bacterium]
MITELLEILIQAGIFRESALNEAAAFNQGSSFVERLLALGHGSETDVIKVIANKLELAVVDTAALNNISQTVIGQIPAELVKKHHVLPFSATENELHIAMVDPTQDDCINELSFFSGKRILPYGVKAGDLARALNRYFGLGISEKFVHGQKPPLPGSSVQPGAAKPDKPVPERPGLTREKPPLPGREKRESPQQAKPPLPVTSKKAAKPSLAPPEPSAPKSNDDVPTKVGEVKEYSGIVEAVTPAETHKMAEEEILNKWAGKDKNEGVAYTDDVKNLLEKQKELLESEFNKRLDDIKSKFREYEEEIKINKLKEELEEKMELKRTMDKIAELEKIKYYQQSGYMPPYSAKGQIYVDNDQASGKNVQKEQDGVSEIKPLLDKIKELQDQIGRIAQSTEPVRIEEKPLPKPEPAVREQPAPVQKEQEDYFDTGEELMDIDKIMDAMDSDGSGTVIRENSQKEYSEKYEDVRISDVLNLEDSKKKSTNNLGVDFFDEVFVSSMEVQVSGILKSKSVEAALNAVVMEMSKLCTRVIVLFVKFENLVGVAGFGPKVEGKVEDFEMPIILPSMFKKVYDSKKSYNGKPVINELTKKFFTYFGNLIPEVVAIVPAMIGKKVFAMIYSEEGRNINDMEKIAQAMSNVFVKFLSDKNQ